MRLRRNFWPGNSTSILEISDQSLNFKNSTSLLLTIRLKHIHDVPCYQSANSIILSIEILHYRWGVVQTYIKPFTKAVVP